MIFQSLGFMLLFFWLSTREMRRNLKKSNVLRCVLPSFDAKTEPELVQLRVGGREEPVIRMRWPGDLASSVPSWVSGQP